MRERWVARGQVQGVGFRHFVHALAQEFQVPAGYVKNLEDGSVEIILETGFSCKETFLNRVQRGNGSEGIKVESLRQVDEAFASHKERSLTFEIR